MGTGGKTTSECNWIDKINQRREGSNIDTINCL